MSKNKFFLVACFFLLISFSAHAQDTIKAPQEIRNIIFMIGDGMGVTQIYAGITANKGKSNFDRFKCIGFSKTYSATDYITESAAGATAFSIGEKTHNEAVGVDTNDQPKPNIREIAQAHGLSTGVVATTDLTDATPADFIAHVSNRHMRHEIAAAYLESDVNVFIGAGKDQFYNPDKGIDLVEKLKDKGYSVCYNLNELEKIKSGKIAGLLPEKRAPERGDQEEIAAMKAVHILDQNVKGFFLMIEGSKIDDAGHANDLPQLIAEVQDFDRVIGKMLDFAKKDGHTLVVVTADHETGGLTLTGGDIKTGKVKGEFSTDDHTSVMVPVFAYGPGAEAFRGIYENNTIFNKFIDAFQFDRFGIRVFPELISSCISVFATEIVLKIMPL